MAFISHCCKRPALKLQCWLLAVLMLCCLGGAHAESGAAQVPVLALERSDDAILLSTQLNFELPAVVEDALLKGIPIYFVASADLLRERWYWTSKRVASVQRHMRLSYHPLTRRWRLNTAAGDISETAQGLTLNQNFDTLTDALSSVRRISGWKIADVSAIEAGSKHLVEFHFQLDVTQLPRPLQMGTLTQSDWLISLSAVQTLGPELRK